MQQQTNFTGTKRAILYYPTISIRTGTWLRQALLYWDEIGSIVPQRYDETTPVPYSHDIQFLKNEGEYRPFRPSALLNQEWGAVRNFENELCDIVLSDEFQRRLPSPAFRKLSARVHQDKLSYQVFHFLEDAGLAKKHDGDYDWFYFESTTALLYMSLLAKYLADDDIQATVPSTNMRFYENLNFKTKSDAGTMQCLTAKFTDALPAPRDDVPLADILDFKRKRRDELLNFRQQIKNFESALCTCRSQREVTDAVTEFSEHLEKGLSDLEAALSDAKLATVAASFEALTKASLPASIPPMLVVAGRAANIARVPIGWAVAGSAITGAILVGRCLVDKRNERRATVRNSAFSYLYMAKRELGFQCRT